jgi:endonuclease/exonuclease/phosphatase family metal-dependent hydrolase
VVRSRAAAVACALAAAGCGHTTEAPAFTLLQMNLCLSGLAGCYARVAYPAGVDDAIALIHRRRPDAVTLNESCRGDVVRIARETGYHLRFSRVVYRGDRLRCAHPRGRGRFGDAVLTRSPVTRTENHAFRTQQGLERRRWLCVATAAVNVCTAHLNTRASAERSGNDAQCRELRAILAARAPVVFAGDVNRRPSCAPRGFWTRTDAAARQAPGLQHAYGTLRSPTAAVLPAAHTDHDVLLVRAR